MGQDIELPASVIGIGKYETVVQQAQFTFVQFNILLLVVDHVIQHHDGLSAAWILILSGG